MPCPRRASSLISSWAPRWARSMVRSWPPTRRVPRRGWPASGRARRCSRRSARPSSGGWPGWPGPARTCTRSSRCARCSTTRCPAGTSPTWQLPFHCVAASIEQATRALVLQRARSCPPCWPRARCPGCCPRSRSTASTTSTAAWSIPSRSAGRIALGARTVYVLHVGRIERPLTVPRRPWEVGLVAFEIARRHRFHEEMAALPGDVRVHVLPSGGDQRPPIFRSSATATGPGRVRDRTGLLRRPRSYLAAGLIAI